MHRPSCFRFKCAFRSLFVAMIEGVPSISTRRMSFVLKSLNVDYVEDYISNAMWSPNSELGSDDFARVSFSLPLAASVAVRHRRRSRASALGHFEGACN